MIHRLSAALLAVLSMNAAPARPDGPTAKSPYGVHSHVTRNDEHPFLDREMELMREAGIRWLRTGFVWASIERREGRRDYANCDAVVARAEQAGVGIMGLLHGTPRWARPTMDHLPEWLAFVQRTVQRYKGRVPAWQVWNEPNLKHFWDDPDPNDYARLLRATYRRIKQADPNATVVWGATSRLDWTFMAPALAGADGAFDVMAIHPYGYGDPRAPEAYIPDALDELRALLDRHGAGGRPIWFTEWGWPTHTGRRGITDRQQAQFFARAHLLALHRGLERSFWYEFQERRETDEANEDAFGIVEHSLKPKPAYVACRTLIRARPAGSRALDRPWKTGLIYHTAWARPDGRTAHAVWNLWGRWRTPRMTSARLHGRLVEAFDYLGRPVKLTVDSTGRTILPLDWGSPIYLVGPERLELLARKLQSRGPSEPRRGKRAAR